MERLPADRDTVRFDQRGWGSSRALPGPHRLDQLADDLIDIVKGLGLDTFVLVGHSLGGNWSLRPADAAGRAPRSGCGGHPDH
ncbi:alpha/beta fold hydrolase [Streptomyces lydicus]|uniref:alpha/beta fold hydrolase n=1 Tax=Streptomyces lydicus TaxID=47763 RepID=UPI001F5145CF|nr:alpha/beta fold hydrolase [Streptomyces lydicus]